MPDSKTETKYISTAQAARSLGVSVSTVKRWVDEGVLPAQKTAGGHRKLLRAEVLALARKGVVPNADVADLVLPSGRRGRVDITDLRQSLMEAMLRGDAGEVRAMVRRGYDAGLFLETLADAVISPAMEQIGHGWETANIAVWQEHRGTLAIVAALFDLHADIAQRAERQRPIALGGAPEGDPYVLASLLAQLVLIDAGWEAINLGPNTPLTSFADAIRQLRPRLVWLSVSHLADSAAFVRNFGVLQAAAAEAGAAVVVGGRALVEPIRSRLPYTSHGDGLAHLAAFARTVHPRPKRPRRGRPPRTRESSAS